ncbi:uncharacterized protein PFL1_03464 [Pseudozyma flocculosa PF-1]|uniref:Oxidation resistance protein 1 n=2 Tax=Pseudozyma flocculosa TaxID=84751 RepID=A0A5C3FAR5_9BASI|nr:uncharacterized protein PFL1_03464 [Pseudozyma flocculosa PF-1]EPQ29177.1 hypothetical protein PFL1_03464 [Pseudozyma flocculosa PF-1]SPO41523.1 uncharacterized protein PSFLO_07005 [Pseudozyma flocculosa]
MASPESPASGGLRRRGGGGGSISGPGGGGHARVPSDGFGSFVEASTMPPIGIDAGPSSASSPPPPPPPPAAFDPGLSEPLDGTRSARRSPHPIITAHQHQQPHRQPSAMFDHSAPPTAAADDDWQTGDLVQDFSPLSPRFPSVGASLTRPSPKRTASSASQTHHWDDWDSFLASHTGELPGVQGGSATSKAATPAAPATHNPADDAFFDAFDMAAKHQEAHRAPSPPIIDLREVERKLNLKRAASHRQNGKDKAADVPKEEEDFFDAFERAPQRALGRGSSLHLEPSQLEDIHDARTSPMRPHSDNQPDYFDSSGTTRTQPAGEAHAAVSIPRLATSPTESTSPSSWTGSLRKTWTSLRGLSGDLVSHLPSASDFIVPPEEGDHTPGTHDAKPGGGLLFASDDRRTSSPLSATERRPSVESRRSPLASSTSSLGAAPSSGPMRARDLFASPPTQTAPNTLRRAPSHSASMPISGAPGFDASSSRQWNTGHWTLDAKQAKRAIPVTLSDRRPETESVCEPWHAARIQAALPPRLQLGRQWKLLYSLDQHGMSLATLYHRVSQGLDPSSTRKVSAGVQEAEGWLRGASAATKAAMGVEGGGQQPRVKHVGGGISIQDAGLVIAIKDDNDNVFGAYVNEKLRPQQHYYGSGECFLWKTFRRSRAELDALAKSGRSDADDIGGGEDEAVASSSHKGKAVETFRWTGKNDYMVLTESDFLSVGGGNGKFGLWIDGALERGVSSRCPAFDNAVLCDDKPRRAEAADDEREGRFDCMGLEVWAVGID